jgi:hypothetical protein
LGADEQPVCGLHGPLWQRGGQLGRSQGQHAVVKQRLDSLVRIGRRGQVTRMPTPRPAKSTGSSSSSVI